MRLDPKHRCDGTQTIFQEGFLSSLVSRLLFGGGVDGMSEYKVAFQSESNLKPQSNRFNLSLLLMNKIREREN
jgi:hypothetical protein